MKSGLGVRYSWVRILARHVFVLTTDKSSTVYISVASSLRTRQDKRFSLGFELTCKHLTQCLAHDEQIPLSFFFPWPWSAFRNKQIFGSGCRTTPFSSRVPQPLHRIPSYSPPWFPVCSFILFGTKKLLYKMAPCVVPQAHYCSNAVLRFSEERLRTIQSECPSTAKREGQHFVQDKENAAAALLDGCPPLPPQTFQN